MAYDRFRVAVASRVNHQLVYFKNRFNVPLPGFAFRPQECTISWWELNSRQECYQDFASWQDSRWDPGGDFFFAGSRRGKIPWWDFCRDVSREFFLRWILPGKLATLWGARILGGILTRILNTSQGSFKVVFWNTYQSVCYLSTGRAISVCDHCFSIEMC